MMRNLDYSFISNNIESALSLIACIAVFLIAVAVIAFVMTLLSLLLAHRKRINEVQREIQACYDNLKWEEIWKKSRSPINEGGN